jgi:hypothetical protein
LWRTLYTERWDNANVAGTVRLTKNQYDFDGRVTYESYPKRGPGQIGPGVHSQYDALGRNILRSEDSELGALNTSTTFGSGFTRTVVDPRNQSTLTSFQAFDEPSEDAVATIAAPEGVSLVIARDKFNKPLSITRSGNGKSAQRAYVYDTFQRLCKTIEPETAATVQDYDGASNVAWRARGLALPSTTSCDTRKRGRGQEDRIWLRLAQSLDQHDIWRCQSLDHPDLLP